MYKKIGYHKDKNCFGNKMVVYRNETHYLVITEDRGEMGYFFVDSNVEFLYPAQTYMKRIGFSYDFSHLNPEIDNDFEIDLSKYGGSVCPRHLKDFIKSRNTGDGSGVNQV